MKNSSRLLRKCVLLTILFAGVPQFLNAQVARSAKGDIELFRSLTAQMTQEAVFVHTDRQTYFSSDSIWLSLYVVDQRFHKPSPWSRNAYLDLLTIDGQRVGGISMELEKGRGAGQIRIPENTRSGIYFVCAYTLWMRNAGTDQLAILPIFVVNPRQGVPEFKGEGLLPYIDFFPEGGHMILGIENRITFQILSAMHLPEDFEGHLVDDEGKEIVAVKSAVEGMGEFSFTPVAGRSYFLVPDSAHTGETQRFPLPAGVEEGMALRVDPVKDGFHISAQMTGQAQENLFLVAHANGLIYQTQEVQMQEGVVQFHLPFVDLKEGINILTILNEAGTVMAERRVFVPMSDLLEIQLGQVKPVVGRRQEVILDIELRDKAGDPVQGGISLSVSQKDPLDHDPRSLPMQMALSGEHQPLSGAHSLFDREESDLWMRAHVPTEIQWTRFLQAAQKPPLYVPELYGPVVRGIVLDPRSGAAIPGAMVMLAVPGQMAAIDIGKSNEEGLFLLSVPSRAQGKELMIRSIGPNGLPSRILLPPKPRLNAAQLPEAPKWPVDARERLKKAFLHQQAGEAYELFADEKATVPPQVATHSFYGIADHVYTLDDFTRFTTEETFVEIIYPVTVRKKKGRFSMRVYNPATTEPFVEEPLLLIDGIPITDAGEILALKPRQLERVEVITARYCKGLAVFGGIVHAITYEHDAQRIKKGPDLLRQTYEFPKKPADFPVRVHSAARLHERRIPDFRPVLHWDPAIRTNEEGRASVRFYVGDVEGEFQIRVEALSPSGNTGSIIQTFEVRATE